MPCTSSLCLLANSFRYYFTGSLTLLFTFPSRYSFTIGHSMYLALHCGQRGFLPEFAVSESTQESPTSSSYFKYTALTFFGQVFHPVLLYLLIRYWSPTTPRKAGFGLFPVRSSLTKGISFDFFSSGYLDISVPQLTLPPKAGSVISL